jgi:hypothetical protein
MIEAAHRSCRVPWRRARPVPPTRELGEMLDSLYPEGNNACMPPGSKLALAIRHVHFENWGTLEDVLLERGFAIRYVDAGRESLHGLDPGAADLLICLGGPIAVTDDGAFGDWLTAAGL